MLLAATNKVMIEISFYWLGVAVFTVVGVLGCLFGLVMLTFQITYRFINAFKANALLYSFLKHRKHYKEFVKEKEDYYKWKNYYSRKTDCS